MIISDYEFHKIDVSFNEKEFMKITSFHNNGGKWDTKVIGITLENQAKLLEILLTSLYDTPYLFQQYVGKQGDKSL